MSIPWESVPVCLPTPELIPQVFEGTADSLQLLLVAPLRPQRAWFPLLFSLLTVFLLRSIFATGPPSQAGGRFVYTNIQVLNLHVWAWSSVDCERSSQEATEFIQESSGLQPGSLRCQTESVSNWGRGRHIDPGRPSIPELADFLIFLSM